MGRKEMFDRLRGEDGQVWSYVFKFFLAALVIGALITQFGPIIWNHISIHGTADDAAEEAVTAYRTTRGNMERVTELVQELLDDRDTRLVGSISVIKGQDGEPDTISVSVRKIVNTFLFENTGYLCRYTEASAVSERPLSLP